MNRAIRAMALAAFVLCAGGAAEVGPAHAADAVSVSAGNESDGKRLTFHWPNSVQADAKISGRVLTIAFEQPLDIDLGHLADLLNGVGTFVRLSPNHKTVSVTLAKDMNVTSETVGNDVVLHLASGKAPPVVASAPPAAERVPKPPTKATSGASAAMKDAANQAPETPQVSKPALVVSTGPDYTRLAFEFPLATTYTANLAEGQLTLAFKSDQSVRLTNLRVDRPPRVRSASGKLEDGTYTATIRVAPGVTLRQWTEANYIIIDLVDPKAPDLNTAQTAPAEGTKPQDDSSPPESEPQATSAPTPLASATASQQTPLAATDEPAAPPAKTDGEVETAPTAKTDGAVETAAKPAPADEAQAARPAQGETAATGSNSTEPNVAPDTVNGMLRVTDIDVSALDERLKHPGAAVGPEGTGADLANPADGATDDEEVPTMDVVPPVVEPPPVKFQVGIKLGSDADRVSFPWGSAVPAAVVRRGERLWIAFGARGDIDLSALDTLHDKGVLSYGVFPADGATVVGMQLDDRLLATVIPVATGWTIALGDSILTTAPDIKLEARTDLDAAEVDAAMSGDLKLAHFHDADVQDDLIFVMSGPKAQGLVGTRRFVDFDVLASAQGLAIRPISDGVDVRVDRGDAVITRPGGLALSGTHLPGAPIAKVPKPPKTSPMEMKFSVWRGPKKVSFNAGQKKRLLHVATSRKEEHLAAELDLVHYLLGYQMPQEALGVLGIMATETPAIASDLHYRALRGVANLMAGRLDEASKDLDARVMPDDPNSDIWLGLLAAGQHNWSKARVLFAKAEPIIGGLDVPWQVRARLAAAEAALGVNDVSNARMNLDFLPRDSLSPEEAGRAALLQARLDEALGENDKALSIYDKLAESAAEPIGVRADLARTGLAASLDKITLDEAIDRLEALRFQWRGDAVEADMLLTLGKLYARLGDYRHALTTMRTAVKHFPGTPIERQALNQMYALFQELYLGGKADEMPPIQALALYYDFKELTPIGPKGDIMIRRLSDRLVAMDLLDQASELLRYQVNNRLDGVARSQVAARLALVQLMNHKAEDALRTINSTRLARLPDTIAAQRRLIEARALMDLKRYGDAIDVISDDAGPRVDRLRADIYWHDNDWAKAGPALEQGLGDSWKQDPALSEGQRFDVMRASIAYVLGGNKTSLARMAREFMPKMKGTPDEHAFTVVISDPGNANLELHSLTAKLASIDTLSAFLDDLKKSDVPEPPVATANTPTN